MFIRLTHTVISSPSHRRPQSFTAGLRFTRFLAPMTLVITDIAPGITMVGVTADCIGAITEIIGVVTAETTTIGATDTTTTGADTAMEIFARHVGTVLAEAPSSCAGELDAAAQPSCAVVVAAAAASAISGLAKLKLILARAWEDVRQR